VPLDVVPWPGENGPAVLEARVNILRGAVKRQNMQMQVLQGGLV
jgi:hypothetical protein